MKFCRLLIHRFDGDTFALLLIDATVITAGFVSSCMCFLFVSCSIDRLSSLRTSGVHFPFFTLSAAGDDVLHAERWVVQRVPLE